MVNMNDHNNNLHHYEEAKEEAKFDLASQIAGILSALIPVLGIMGISFDWFTQEWVDNFYILILAVITLVINVYTIIKNHYASKKAIIQKKVLKQHGVEKIDP